jgi:heme-degrading monooxygenase HmoA
MQILLVKFQSGLSHDEVVRKLEERLPLFRAVPGLIQKYYARETATGDYVGVYLFESEQALRDYRASNVARGIPGVYQVQGAPRIEEMEVLFPMHEEK